VAQRRKDWKSAEAALVVWLSLDPKNGKVRESLAGALFRQGQHDRAMEELKQACQEDSKLEPAGVTLGWLWTEAGNLTKAEQCMMEAVGQGRRAQLGYANWLLEQNRPQEAKKHADAAAEHNSQSQEVQVLRGVIARNLKDYAGAEQLLLALHVEWPGNFVASNNLALALVEQSDPAKRRRGLELAEINARLYPNLAEALCTLGRAYNRQGRLEDAEQALRAALATGTGSSDAFYYLAQVVFERGRPGEVKPLLKVALDASGFFSHRKEAQLWTEQLAEKP
jgi:tetratricopeptide (TPR) repeat protein